MDKPTKTLQKIAKDSFQVGFEVGTLYGRDIGILASMQMGAEILQLRERRTALERFATLNYDADQWEQFRAGLLEGRNGLYYLKSKFNQQ